MQKPRAYIHYKMGNRHYYGGIVIGPRFFKINAVWSLIGVLALLACAWGGVAISLGAGWVVALLPAMVLGGLVLLAVLAFGTVNLVKWFAEEFRHGQKTFDEGVF